MTPLNREHDFRYERRPTDQSTLPIGLEKRLIAYAFVAGAGIALSSAARAEIVYTDVHRAISGIEGTTVYIDLDLNNDGIEDFILSEVLSSSGGHGAIYGSPVAPSNRIIGTPLHSNVRRAGAAPLKSGALIGPGAKFITGRPVLASSYECHQAGPWTHKIDTYLTEGDLGNVGTETRFA
jgi:hypothetical protein